MYTETDRKHILGDPSYDRQFWDVMRGSRAPSEILGGGYSNATGGYELPSTSNRKYHELLLAESNFRKMANVLTIKGKDERLWTRTCNDLAMWVPEGGEIPLRDGMADFTRYVLGKQKLATAFKLDQDIIFEPGFHVEDYLLRRLAKNFALAEDDAFINGTGENMPVGILADKGGGEIGVTTTALTYEDIAKLFFSVKPEYRNSGVWMMNDETAYALRTLKDESGNYIWNHINDTILGKKVYICNAMPSVGTGTKPLAFGDFSYYWIVDRAPVNLQPLVEEYALYDQVGYVGYEFLDAKLIRPEAIKVIQITA